VSSPQTPNSQHSIAALPRNEILATRAERRRLAEVAQRKALHEAVERLVARRAKEAAERNARRAAANAKRALTLSDTQPATDAELEAMLADFDMNASAGTETFEEVIETMTEADLDSIEPPATVAPAPSPVETAEPIPDPASKAELESLLADLDEVSNEVTGEAPLVSNEVTSVAASARIEVSNEVTKRRRRSDANDRQVLEMIRNWAPARSTAEIVPLVATPSPSLSPSPTDTLPIAPTDTLRKRRRRKKRTIGSWDHTSDRAKLAAATTALQVWENATSWTFDLTKAGIDAALAHPQGFIRSLSRALNRELKRKLGFVPHYFFSADITKQGRLHLHGGIRADADLLPVIEKAMKKVWGEWEGRGKEHQLKWNPQRCDDGWPDYFLQARARVKDLIGEHTYIITKELRRRAKFIHGEICETCSPTTRLAA
jgi:hypothetical protein